MAAKGATKRSAPAPLSRAQQDAARKAAAGSSGASGATAKANGKPSAGEPSEGARVVAVLTRAKLDVSSELTAEQRKRALEAPAGLSGKALATFVLEGKTGREQVGEASAARKRDQRAVTRGGFREGGTPAEILAVLTEAGEPLHVKVITERVLARGNASLKGKTPTATVAAVLSVEARKEGSPFRKVERGTFALAEG